MRTKQRVGSILITDPVVNRLWLFILFFSSPLYCYYDRSLPEVVPERKLGLNQIQNSYVLLLWHYLLHRHGFDDSVRIYANLVRAYLQMQRIAQAANTEIRTRHDLIDLNRAFNRAAILDDDMS